MNCNAIANRVFCAARNKLGEATLIFLSWIFNQRPLHTLDIALSPSLTSTYFLPRAAHLQVMLSLKPLHLFPGQFTFIPVALFCAEATEIISTLEHSKQMPNFQVFSPIQ